MKKQLFHRVMPAAPLGLASVAFLACGGSDTTSTKTDIAGGGHTPPGAGVDRSGSAPSESGASAYAGGDQAAQALAAQRAAAHPADFTMTATPETEAATGAHT